MRKLILLIPICLMGLSSCKIIRSNLMLRTPKNYVYALLSDSISKLNYRIAHNDAIQYRVFTNDGFKLIDLANSINATAFRNDLDVMVETDGTVKLPMIGNIKLEGMSLREAEKFLEDKYAEYYVKPFVSLKVTNKRVIVFPGNGGLAKSITLSNNNTSVIEAIALAGGLTEDSKAYKVKLLRTINDTKPQVFIMDLSHIDGLAAGNTRVLANDIIYVEPRYRLARTLVTELTPLVTLISTTFLIYTLVRTK